MQELFSSPSADFDHPIEILEGCHQRIRRTCALIERIARHVQDKGCDDEAKKAVATAMRYFDVAGAHHHRDEEDDLFPALERLARGGDKALVAALLERLRREHGELDAAWADMRRRLEAIATGSEAAMGDAPPRFTRAYERHMEIEEASLFPLSRRLLDEETVAALGRAMAARRGVARPG